MIVESLWKPQTVMSSVSRVGLSGVSNSLKFKGLVKVGASKGVIRVD